MKYPALILTAALCCANPQCAAAAGWADPGIAAADLGVRRAAPPAPAPQAGGARPEPRLFRIKLRAPGSGGSSIGARARVLGDC